MNSNLICLLAIVLHYNMSTNPSIRMQLRGSAERKLKQMNDEKVNNLRGSMDQLIKIKPTLISEIVNRSSSDLACTNLEKTTIVSSEYSDATDIAESTVNNSGLKDLENGNINILLKRTLDSVDSDVTDTAENAVDTGTGSISVIKEICCIDSGKKEITSLPENNNCTGLAYYSNGHTSSADIDSLRRGEKKVFILNDYGYSDYKHKLNPKHLDGFLKKLISTIDDNDINIIIFEGLVMFDDPGYNNLFQMNVRRMILRLNVTRPKLLCGIFLRWSPDIGVNVQYLEKVVPFFVLRSFDNHRCNHKKHQRNMDPVDPVGEIEDKVKGILSIMNGEKLCIVIRIIVKYTWTSYAKHKDDKSYSELCTKDVYKNDRFCIETLPNFYKKGRLVSKYNLAGAVIQSFDRDDYACECGCGCYPAMTAIDAGIQGLPEPNVTNCLDWHQ